MPKFIFDAPALTPDARGGRPKRLLCWLRDRLVARGVLAAGPKAGEAGWGLFVNAEDGFVAIRVGSNGGDGRSVVFNVEQFGEAGLEFEDTLAACEDVRTIASPHRSTERSAEDLSVAIGKPR